MMLRRPVECTPAIVRADSSTDSPRAQLETAIQRTTERYASAQHADRFYVTSKLRTDPLIQQLAELDLRLGRVIDAGCGRGQIGLLLLELGAASSLVGWDWDEHKIDVARAAAGSEARFECSDLVKREWPEADSVLLIDVLHYLDRRRQTELLERAAGSLAPGGRIMLRELDRSAGFSAWLGMLFERIAVKLSYNRGAMLEFRSAAEIAEQLSALGLRVQPGADSEAATLGNRLMIAERPASS
jgi:2-polyprenyl-3-methyl-5-hydroxy-6-metoxy-1,4-benzoquinol methylase